jgi:hypothetical protein
MEIDEDMRTEVFEVHEKQTREMIERVSAGAQQRK